jgi:NAD-dependent SIR2 family protein deacetylase
VSEYASRGASAFARHRPESRRESGTAVSLAGGDALSLRPKSAVDVASFLHTYHIRAPNIMWFLGAGASAAANVPTAGDMIWDFKRRLYCAAQHVSLASCGSLADPMVRTRLQAYFDGRPEFPRAGADDEYAAYFEAVYPDSEDRRRYIDRLVAGGTPSYGHLVLAALLRMGKARVIWTPNFDVVIEDAAVPVLGSIGRLTVATLDTASIALRVLNEGAAPLLVKLHGDFRSSRLKNTAEELQQQDGRFRAGLVDACRRSGLAVVGYSGRDHSVMAALEEAIDGAAGPGYPTGLFWFHRGDDGPPPSVTRLLDRARAAGVDANLIRTDTFDELMGDLFRLAEDVPRELAEQLARRNQRVSDAPVPAPGTGYPVVRLNALPVVAAPSVCRLVDCRIGGTRDVRAAVERAAADLVVARRRSGVLAFGRDADVRRAFDPHDISRFDLHAIEPRRLAFDSAEHGLLLEALARALARERPLRAVRRRSGYQLVVDESRSAAFDSLLAPLRLACGMLSGSVPGTELAWTEAAWARLDFRLGRVWLLLEPTVWTERSEDGAARQAAGAFVLARTSGRFNRQANALLDAWVMLVAAGDSEATVRAFGIGDGVDASFTISQRTAFTRRDMGAHGRRDDSGSSAAGLSSRRSSGSRQGRVR